MEETCLKLSKEIAALREENAKLELIHLANGISRLNKAGNDEELTNW